MTEGVLVSGGTGFVGRFIVEDLLANGYPVSVGGRHPPPSGYFSGPVGFRSVTLDPGLDQSAAFHGFEFFVHAALQHVEGKFRGGEGNDPLGFRRANLAGSVRLFEEARDGGVRRCVFLSSRAVYGTCPAGTILDEATPPRPDTLYGTVKRAAERELRALSCPGFATTSLRITGVYGPAGAGRKDKWRALFADYLAGRPIAPRVATEVHGMDVASAVRLMLEADDRSIDRQAFNVSDLLLDRHDLLAIVQSATGSACALPDRADPATATAMTTGKIRQLEWQPGGWPLLERTVRELLDGLH